MGHLSYPALSRVHIQTESGGTMTIDGDGCVRFTDARGTEVGRYRYDDPYKPHFASLRTPAGVEVVQPPPADHPHHRGLQYGLCLADVNFWEESRDAEFNHSPAIGVQVHRGIEGLPDGFRQTLVWRDKDDSRVSFTETRTIRLGGQTASSCTWTWDTVLVARRPVTIETSNWPGPGYCGLGVRLAPDTFLGGTLVPNARSGDVPAEVVFRGRAASVAFAQELVTQRDVLFVMGKAGSADGFAFLALGRANGGAVELAEGDLLVERFTVIVSDA